MDISSFRNILFSSSFFKEYSLRTDHIRIKEKGLYVGYIKWFYSDDGTQVYFNHHPLTQNKKVFQDNITGLIRISRSLFRDFTSVVCPFCDCNFHPEDFDKMEIHFKECHYFKKIKHVGNYVFRMDEKTKRLRCNHASWGEITN